MRRAKGFIFGFLVFSTQTIVLMSGWGVPSAQGGEPRLVSSGPEGVVLEIEGTDYRRRSVLLGGRRFDRVELPGATWLPEVGAPAVPVRGVLIGVPYGVDLSVEVEDVSYDETPGVDLMPVPETYFVGRGQAAMPTERYAADAQAYGRDVFYPAQEAVLTQTGMMRDQRVAALSLRPLQYNPVRKALRVARRLRVRVRFVERGAARPALRPTDEGDDGAFGAVYRKALLNATQARAWRASPVESWLGKASADWYDPAATYYKLRIREDGVYRLDADWFAASGISLGTGDLTRLRLYLNGEEAPLEVRDGGDGRLDAEDGVFFYGTYRRATDRDFESEFGREHVYWLTLAGGGGRRFLPVDAAPRSGFPEAVRFTATVHAEADSMYEPLGDAADHLRDHWYWTRTASPVAGLSHESPVTVPVVLPGLDREAPGTTRLRVGMHGLTHRESFALDHRTVVRLPSGFVVAEDRWDGQAAFVAEGEAPVGELADTTLVTLATPGSPDYPEGYVEHVLFNWVTVTYPRRYQADGGRLLFDPGDVGEGRTISIPGFRTPTVRVYDLDGARALEGAEVTQEGSGYRARFEVAAGGRYAAFDAEAVLRPEAAEMDIASDLRGERAGADYVLVTHASLWEAAQRLAAHRRAQGLSVRVVDVTDIYDEFAFGQLDPEAVRAFMTHAFHTWSQRPAYLLLFGRASFDYRDFFNEWRYKRRNLVPALPYQEIRRGLAFTDHRFGAVAGDDLFQDLYVGRLSVNNTREADAVVEKMTAYDLNAPARWHDRVLYLANHDADSIFIAPSNALAADYTEPLGLETFRVYNGPDTPPEPNEDTREAIRQINEGRLVVNFMGHGSAASMRQFFAGTFQQGDYNYMSQIVNGNRLPLFMAMTCLNGLYAEPRIICMAEEMTNKPNGGALAYVSASSLGFVFANTFTNTAMFRHIFQDSIRQLGQALALAKVDMLASYPGLTSPAQGLNLMGDPAQALAVPAGPDFALSADGLRVAPDRDLAVGDSARVSIRMENLGVIPRTGLDVALVVRSLEEGDVDTLFAGELPPFGQADSLTALWRLTSRAGAHRLEVVLDSADRIAELNEANNRLDLDVMVYGRLTAAPTMPAESQAVTASGALLAVRSGAGTEGEVLGEFEVSASPAFDGTEVIRSGLVGGENGLVTWRPPGLANGTYFWRARLSDGGEAGPWTRAQAFAVAASVPQREAEWQQRGADAYLLGMPEDVTVFGDGSVGRVTDAPPMRFHAETREAEVAAEGVLGTAVVCTDGTYLYVKRFYTVPAIYPGTDVFMRIGTGYGGTVAGQNYGALSETPVPGVSATYHGDGFIYADDGKARDLARISPVTGSVDRVSVPDGLLEMRTGLIFDGYSLITSDGTHIYNMAFGVNGVKRAGWAVRVFDPADGWRLVRAFTAPPTATGFGYLFTDGVIADGRYLYLIEFSTGLTHRVRVVDAQDGHFVAESESDQAQTDILGGQYDWVNNKVWLGQLEGPMVFRYAGRGLPVSGSLTSSPIGPATGWGQAQVTLVPASTPGARAEIDVLGEAPSGAFLPIEGWTGLPPVAGIDLQPLGDSVRRIRLRARLFGEGLNPSPGLTAWSVRYRPAHDLALLDLRVEPLSAEEAKPVKLTTDVLNRGPLDLVMGTVLGFYAGPPEDGRLIGRMAVPEATPVGRKTSVLLVWQTAGFRGRHTVTVRTEDLQGHPDYYGRQMAAAMPVEIVPCGDKDAPEVEISALDAAGEVRPDDYLPAEPRLRIVLRDSSGIDAQSVQLVLKGLAGETQEGMGSPAIRDREDDRTFLSFIYAPHLEDDRYVLEVSARDRLGNGPAQKTLAFQVSSELRMERVLNVPNPMATQTDFTYILSRTAEVTIRIYTVAGRLVRILDNVPGRPGFNQAAWDGTDSAGRPLANGTYLYSVTAEGGAERVRVKEKLIVYR